MKIKPSALALACTCLLTQITWGIGLDAAMAARFIDLSGNWTEKYVNTLSDAGVIPAESDGKFRPQDPITRAQLAQWLVKTLSIENQAVNGPPSFPDVSPSSPEYKAIEICKQNNFMTGYPDGFRPKQTMQRGEMISVIARSLGASTPDDGTIAKALASFSDKATIPNWARSGIAQAKLAGILVSADNNATAKAVSVATRGDAAAILAKLSDYKSDQAVKQALNYQGMDGATRTPAGNSQAAPAASAPPGSFTNNSPYNGPGFSNNLAQAQGGPNFQGQIQHQNYTPPNQGYPQPGQPEQFSSQPPQFYQGQPQYAGGYQQPPQQPLSGRVVMVGAGTQLPGTLRNSLDSGSTQVGEPVEATLTAPVYSGGVEVIPAGSRVLGSVTNVVSSRRFRFGANGRIDMRFNMVETPDGRRFPLSASVNDTQLKLVGGSTAGRVGKGALTTAVGAGSGAALGTALGAIVGATSNGQVGKATGMGAVFGTAIGGGLGLVGAGVRKGSEVIIKAGTPMPIQLDESMQVTTGGGGAPIGGQFQQPFQQPQYQQPQFQQPQYQQPQYQQPQYQQPQFQPQYQQPQYQPQYQQQPNYSNNPYNQ
ncbi:MAG: S-layer homology domain-containing protein [Candidatus Obscuribacterales bacterium]|nr:S-layer homology domain-containing protein [Candidatus Obscuribacterales bacterium]